MPPFSLPKSTKIPSKINFKRHRFFDRFGHRFLCDFGSVLGPKLGPCWRLFRPKWGPLGHASAFFVTLPFFSDFWALLATAWPPFGVHFGRYSASSCLNFGEHLGLSWVVFSSQAPTQIPNFSMDPFVVALPLVVRVVAGTRLAALKIRRARP